MGLVQLFYEVLENPTILGVCTWMFMFFGPIWVAFFIGIILGWAWKPKWASLGLEKLASSFSKSLDLCLTSSPSNAVMSSLVQSPNPDSLAVGKKPPAPGNYDSSCRYLTFIDYYYNLLPDI